MRLPELKFNLPEWRESDFALLRKSQEKMKALAGKSGKGSDRFKNACQRLWRLAITDQGAAIPAAIHNSIDVRALTHLLADNKEFIEKVTVNLALLESLYTPRPKLGSLSLLQLIGAFFAHFDQIAKKEVFNRLCEIIILEICQRNVDSNNDEFANLYKYRNILFTIDGPVNVVEFSKVNNLDLDQTFKKMSLHNYHGGRFQQITRFHYYLHTLRNIPVGQDHPVLTEVCKQGVYNALASEGRLMGHEILTILIDRTGHQKVSDSWRNVVMTVAGDPRVPSSSKKYQQWWAILGDERVSKVRGWLSEFDLRLFLRVLEEYGHSSGNQSLQRMFPARRAFLKGLLDQGLISHSRLFVCGHAENYLKANFRQQELPEYARMKDASRSMIYLEVGGLSIVEGSHNFKMWIFPKMPPNAELKRYGGETFDPDDLSYGLKRKYLNTFGRLGPSVLAITHNPNITWQASAITQLRQLGLRLDVEELFSQEDYRQYKARFGL